MNKNQKNADYKNSITIIIIILWTRCSIRKNINEKLKIIKILFEKNKLIHLYPEYLIRIIYNNIVFTCL